MSSYKNYLAPIADNQLSIMPEYTLPQDAEQICDLHNTLLHWAHVLERSVDPAAVERCKAALDSALTAANKAAVEKYRDFLVDLEQTAFWSLYSADPTAPISVLAIDKESGKWSIKPASRYLPILPLLKARKEEKAFRQELETLKLLLDTRAAIAVDSTIVYDSAKKADAAASVLADSKIAQEFARIPAEYAPDHREQVSKTALLQQLARVWEETGCLDNNGTKHICPIKADVNFLLATYGKQEKKGSSTQKGSSLADLAQLVVAGIACGLSVTESGKRARHYNYIAR